jgi:hypothetical protein
MDAYLVEAVGDGNYEIYLDSKDIRRLKSERLEVVLNDGCSNHPAKRISLSVSKRSRMGIEVRGNAGLSILRDATRIDLDLDSYAYEYFNKNGGEYKFSWKRGSSSLTLFKYDKMDVFDFSR